MDETDGKTALTPQQMREQAVVNDEFAEASEREGLITDMRLGRQNAAALRVAADQLEAVQARVRDYYYENGFTESAADHLIAFLAAGTAPQEGRDD